MTKNVRKLRRHRADVQAAVEGLWESMAKGDVYGARNLYAFLKQAKKEHYLRRKQRRENKEMIEKQENNALFCEETIEFPEIEVQGFCLDLGGGMEVKVSKDGTEPKIELCGMKELTPARWEVLVANSAEISDLINLVS